MKKIVVLWLLFHAGILLPEMQAQHKPQSAGKLIDGKLVLTIDLRWTAEQQNSFVQLYQLDSLTAAQLFQKNVAFFQQNKEWDLEIIDNYTFRLLQKTEEGNQTGGLNRFEIMNEAFSERGQPIEEVRPLEAHFGVNQFTDHESFKYTDGKAHFFLRGYEKARKVMLAGSFNEWSTLQSPMKFNGKGWELSLGIPPGKHSYKFIVDGRWLPDPANRKKEEDGHNHQNSIVFCPNHVFSLEGYQHVKRVFLSGSFNGWRERNLPMIRKENGWQLPVYLRDGTYTYKFVIDGEWITDPANAQKRADGNGNENSVIAFGEQHRFFVKGFEQAEEVKISGTFNDWNPNELHMKRIQGGWEFFYHLAPGIYEYKIIVDGHWMQDPENPFHVGEHEYKNSVLVFRPNYTFRFIGEKEVKKVSVTGSFNRWDKAGYPMQKIQNEWVLPIFLYPGRHSYKFIIDGQWQMDESNPLWEENEYGTGNSVLWIK